MMRSLGNNSGRRSPALAQAGGLVALTLALMLLGYVARGAIASVVTPLFAKSAGTSDNLGRLFGGLSQRGESMDALVAQVADLQSKVSSAEILLLDRNQLYEENTALKEQFGRIAEPNRLLATILARPNATPYDVLIIDAGSDHQVQVGDLVSAGGSLLLGKVSEVFAHSAKVRLYSSPGETYDGFLRGTIPIKVFGQGGGSLTAEVPYDAKVVEGDTVSLPTLEANTAFIVEHVEMGQGNSATKIFLRLPVSAFNLRFVEVWRQTH